MLPPATWLALLKYSPLPTSAQKDISDSLQQAQQQPDPEQAKRDAELKLPTTRRKPTSPTTRRFRTPKSRRCSEESAAKRESRRRKPSTRR
jgi:hypothetical protein